METLLIIKTGALGDVLRTTSILPGLARATPGLRITWLTAHEARELVEHHPLLFEVVTANVNDGEELRAVRDKLTTVRWDRVLSLDDEQALCALASSLECERLSGACLAPDGSRTYTEDVAPWFDMGLLSKFGKQRADELKIANRASHAELYARMFGIEASEPELPLSAEAVEFGLQFEARHGLAETCTIGLNTGAGGRWTSKQLSVEKTVALAAELARDTPPVARGAGWAFVVLGGPAEQERNLTILAGLRQLGLTAVDAGSGNTLGEFAAIVSRLSLLVTSDSLALHVAVARQVPVAAFFAPTSGAEIELYGRGEKVLSTAPDYCTYRSDVDTSTITVERLAAAARSSLNREL